MVRAFSPHQGTTKPGPLAQAVMEADRWPSSDRYLGYAIGAK
jgi:hypothetical protein